MEEKILRGVFDFFVEYDIIRLEGKYVEKFFNIATRKNIQLWNVRYIGKSVAVFSCYRKDYDEILKISDKISAKLYIMDSKGAMHEIKKYKNRVSLYLGALFMAVVIMLLSNTVCEITVSGLERIPEEVIYSQLKQSGLYKGKFKKNINTKEVRKKILALNNDITWIGIELKGARASVEVVEKVPKPEIVDKKIAVNIVALKDGIVENIVVKDGFVIAKKGDTVRKGDLLVSGISESKQGDIMTAHSVADIKLKTFNYIKQSFPVEVAERIPTSEIKNRYRIEFFGKKVNLFLGEMLSDKEYDKMYENKSLVGNFILLEKIKCNKVETVIKKYSDKYIFENNKEKLYSNVINQLSENHMVLDTEYNYTFDGKNVEINLCVVALEDGGVSKAAQY